MAVAGVPTAPGGYSVPMRETTQTSNDISGVRETHLDLPNRRQGKVRDIYSVPRGPHGGPGVLIVASDRVSAFDVVMPTIIPGKGQLLTAISTAWFEKLRGNGIIADHLVSTDPADLDGVSSNDYPVLNGRMMLGRATEVIPIEFVVRGYLAGSGWNEYVDSGTVCGIELPAGLERCGRLPAPIFTPATKEDEGHDENINFERACDIAGREVMERLRDVSMRLYAEAAAHAESCGIILADTKLEFGYALDNDGNRTDEILLIDEIFTPDSSRFWPKEEYEAGREQDSFDKQYVRNHLLELVNAGQWDKTPPGPALPDEIVRNTLLRYQEAFQRLFG